MKNLFFFIVAILYPFAQNLAQTIYFSEVDNTPLGLQSKYNGAVQLEDGSYILNLNTDSATIFTVSTNKLHVVKMDALGNLVWSKSFGKVDCHYTQFDIVKVNEDLFALAGIEERTDTTFAMIAFINANGDSLGLHRYFTNGDYHLFNRIIKTSDGGFLAVGEYRKDAHYPYPSNYNLSQSFVVKTDSIGNEVWQLSYGAVDFIDYGTGVVETNDHDYLIGGSSEYGYNVNLGKTYGQLTKITQGGVLEWSKNYPDTTHREFFNNMKLTLSGDLFICGGYEIYKPPPLDNIRIAAGLILKMDIEGEVLWKKAISTTGLKFYDFVELSDGSIVTIGHSLEEEDSGLFKFTDDGEEIWRNVYLYNYIHSNPFEALYKIINTTDKGFLMTGFAKEISSDSTIYNKFSGWVLKVDSTGCVDQLCLTPSQDELQASISVYPNPFNAGFRVVLPAGHDVSALRLLDLAGRTCYQRGIESYDDLVDVEAADLPAGMYFLELLSKQGRVVYQVVKVE
jgi:hypothetical protein